MERVIIETNVVPKPIGPYSQAVVCGGTAYLSMQLPIDPDTGLMVEGAIEDQARRALENLRELLYASGSGLSGVLKVMVYFADLADFDRVNRVYSEFFGDSKPARAAIQAAALPRGARIGFDAIAAVKG